MLGELPKRVKALLDSGASKKDIAILVRTRNQGRMVASALIAENIDVISNDSLFIGASVAVQKILLTLRAINNADKEDNGHKNIFNCLFNRDPYIPSDLQGKSIYECCEEIIRESLTVKDKEELPYIEAFLDCALDFSLSEGANLQAFLKWWDESGSGKTISAPEDADAVNIMTIHKSKGLGFKIVIIPFFKDVLEKFNDRIWASLKEIEELEFNLPVPVPYNSNMLNSCFSDDYYKEKLFMYVDNLNTSYVACTRAKEQLIIYAVSPSDKSKNENKVSSIRDALHIFLKEGRLSECCQMDGEEITSYTLGDPIVYAPVESASLIDSSTFLNVFEDNMDYAKTRVSLTSDSINQEDSIRNYGIAMHYIFSLIKTADDITDAINMAINEGVYSGDFTTIYNEIKKIISSVDSYGWFNPAFTILNESDIIKTNGSVCRPDRLIIDGNKAIVVDYKFGKYQDDSLSLIKYKRQIEEYIKLLYDLGYTNVEGYIWYPLENVIL